ncbi:MAG: hypothetical protein ACRECD_01155 [Burkholderiaceae bacterium]
MIFTLDIKDAKLLAGIAAARQAYNAANAQDKAFVPLASDADYIAFVMQKACESYCNQYQIT